LLARLEGDEALLTELITLFLEDTPQRLNRLCATITTHDWHTATQLIQSLKGAASNLCAHGMFKAVQHLEALLEAENTPQFAEAITHLEAEIRHLQATFAAYVTSH
jgi:HPt (histidine-containing phosphotransfer) domain-containing protein